MSDLEDVPSIEEVLSIAEEAIREKKKIQMKNYLSKPGAKEKIKEKRRSWYQRNKHKYWKSHDPEKYESRRESHRRAARAYYQRNKESILAKNKQKRLANKDFEDVRAREYYLRNKERINKKAMERHKERMSDPAYREKVNKKSRDKYWRNRDKELKKSRDYYQRNKESILARKKEERRKEKGEVHD